MSADTGLVFVVAMAVIVIALALLSDAAMQRWRLAAAAAAMYGAVGLAIFAIDSPSSEMWRRFPEEAVLAIRCFSGAAAIWTAYLAIDQVITWWRVGDKSEDD